MAHPVGIAIDGDSTCSVMHVDGDINWETSSELRTAILHVMNSCEERVVVDLKGVRHIDKVGASVLYVPLMRPKNGRLIFCLRG